jgi:hypothetical protein
LAIANQKKGWGRQRERERREEKREREGSRCCSKADAIFAVSGLFQWSAVCCYLTGHKLCKHQIYREVLKM